MKKAELDGILKQMNYPVMGKTRKESYDQLLQNLISIKMTYEHMDQIR